jgi:riboflavin kinase / FMN adenylyltransferase
LAAARYQFSAVKLYNSLDAAAEAGDLKGAAAALGNFDGVHLGHRALIQAATEKGKGGVITFHPHPGKVLQPDLAPKLIATAERKLELLAEVGATFAVVQPFNTDFARTAPAAFEQMLFDRLGLEACVVGADFTYGSKRAGNAATLATAAHARNATVHTVPQVVLEGVVVSSSKVREYILEGRVEAAERLLGRPFDLDGTVVKGAARGRTIGFPTANIDTDNELKPAPGVYAVRVRKQPSEQHSARGAYDSSWHAAAANIGVKPTFGGTEVTIEAHLLDFSGDLYGQLLRVQFIARLRPEMRFGSVAELTAQIKRDVERAREAIARVGA